MIEFILRTLGFLACQGLCWVWVFAGPLTDLANQAPTPTLTLAFVLPALVLKACAFACAGFGFCRWA